MIGAFLNALGILLGALFGLVRRELPAVRTQNFFKSALAAATAFFGLRLVWENVHGTFASGLKQLFLAALAVVLGNWLGKILRLQKISNRIGRHASGLLTTAQKNPPGQPADGFLAATILFCAAPLGIVGAVADGLSGYFYLLAVKAVMDALAMMSFVKIFHWPAALAAIPVYLFLNGLTLLVHSGARPWLEPLALIGSVNLAAGIIVCAMVLVILEVRRVELANYLPALALAPLLARYLG